MNSGDSFGETSRKSEPVDPRAVQKPKTRSDKSSRPHLVHRKTAVFQKAPNSPTRPHSNGCLLGQLSKSHRDRVKLSLPTHRPLRSRVADPGIQFQERLISAKTSDEVFAAVPAHGPEWDRLNAFLRKRDRTILAEIDHAGKRLFANGTLVREIRAWGQKYHRPEAATKIERALALHFKHRLPVLQRQLEASLNLRLCYLRDVPLPQPIRFLTNLKVIDLRNNGLTFVPEVIHHLSDLTSLLLGFNQITGLPPWLEELESLHTLNLEPNPIATADPRG